MTRSTQPSLAPPTPRASRGGGLGARVRAAALGLALGAAACGAGGPERMLEEADALYYQRHYEAAARTYERLVAETGKTDPRAREIHVASFERLAHLRHHFLGDVDGALRAYRALVELGPEPAVALHARLAIARLLRDRQGELPAALDALREVEATLAQQAPPLADPAFRLDPLRMEIARLAFRLERLDVATAALEAVLSSTAEVPATVRREALLLASTVHAQDGRPELALEGFFALQAQGLDRETDARVRFEIARCLERLGRFEEALVAYDAALGDAIDAEVIEARATRVRARLTAQRGAVLQGQRIAGATSIRP